MYIVPAVFSVLMIFNGLMKYWGGFDKEATKAVFYHYRPSKREEENWSFSQKIYGKYLLAAGCLNVVTEIVLIPLGMWILQMAEDRGNTTIPMILYMFGPSLIYMFGARILMQLKLRK